MRVRELGNESSIETVFLHGFPSLRSEQNTPLVNLVAKELNRKTFQLFYSGLGQAEGQFLFSQCVEDVRNFFAERVRANPKVQFDVVGHSWGGFLAVFAASEFSGYVRKLVLLSPLVEFSKAQLSKDALAYYASLSTASQSDVEAAIVQGMPYKFNLGDTQALARDYNEVGEKNLWSDMTGKLNPKLQTIILQASDDTITPREYIEVMVPKFPKDTEFEIVENIHSFLEDRPGIAKRISNFFIS